MADTKALTYEFFKAINDEGLDGMRPYLADDCVYWVAGMGEIQDTLPGLGAVLRQNLNGPMTMKVHDVIVDGNRSAVEAESHAVLRNGSVFNNHYHFKLFFENGKVKTIKEYHDTKHANEIWSPIFAEGS
jgi:ketosteroid isomerase-like protein